MVTLRIMQKISPLGQKLAFRYSELGCCENSSKVDESMKFGMMVGIDHTNKFRLVGKLKYA